MALELLDAALRLVERRLCLLELRLQHRPVLEAAFRHERLQLRHSRALPLEFSVQLLHILRAVWNKTIGRGEKRTKASVNCEL